jgi:hypothetical protein
LLVSALLTLAALAIVVLVIVRRRDFSFDGFGDLGSYGVWAIVLAAIAMGALSVGRTVLESFTGPSILT